jgi:hypothetical protein
LYQEFLLEQGNIFHYLTKINSKKEGPWRFDVCLFAIGKSLEKLFAIIININSLQLIRQQFFSFFEMSQIHPPQ